MGDLHLSLVDGNTFEPHAATFIANISGFLKGADAVVTNLASAVPNEEPSTIEILRSVSAGVWVVPCLHVHFYGREGHHHQQATEVDRP